MGNKRLLENNDWPTLYYSTTNMSPKLEQQFNNNAEEERANNRNYLFKKFKR